MARPVTLTNGTNPQPGLDPEALVVVGDGIVIEQQAAIANITADPGVLADLPAARTAITNTNNKVNAMLAALRAAGVIAT